MVSLSTLAFLTNAAVVLATSCSASSQCPESEPCCNQYGECGVGAHCLGGCNPVYSFKPEACMPMPVCKDLDTTFGTQSFPNIEEYLGDPDDTDWVYTGYALNNDAGDALLITMPKDTSGTVLSSSRYMLYGKYGATLKTSRGNGVVTGFISYSDSMDEIDWEWVGYQLEISESNYYHDGVLDWTNSLYINCTDTFENFHLYEVDWQEDQISWSIDGEVKRTLLKADTYNATTGKYNYPQTPARVQFSLWPVLDTAGTGTKEWAGGVVDWTAEDVVNDGYFYMTIKDAYITCASLPSDVKQEGSNAYVYTSASDFSESSIALTDDTTVLCSFDNSGLDDNSACASNSTTASTKSSGASNSTVTSSETVNGSNGTSDVPAISAQTNGAAKLSALGLGALLFFLL